MALSIFEVVTFSNAVESFFIAKRAQRLSEHTLCDYRNTFKKFIQYIGDDCEIESLDSSTIACFLAESKDVSKKTILNYHTGLSSLWNYLVEMGIVENNIVRLVKPPRPDVRQILPFTKQDIIAILGATKDRQFEIRDRAIILLLLDTGIRSAELCALKLKNISLDNRRIVVKGKGDKERKLPICDVTHDALQSYFRLRGLSKTKDYHTGIFITSVGKVINRGGLRKLMERIGIRSDVPNCHPHRFRHTFAIQFLRNGGNIYTLQALLGHTTLDMVKRYLAIAQMDLERDHERASPVRRWGL